MTMTPEDARLLAALNAYNAKERELHNSRPIPDTQSLDEWRGVRVDTMRAALAAADAILAAGFSRAVPETETEYEYALEDGRGYFENHWYRSFEEAKATWDARTRYCGGKMFKRRKPGAVEQVPQDVADAPLPERGE